MKQDTRRIFIAAAIPLFVLFILYLLEFLEVGMDWDFTHLGVYPRAKRGVFGIFAHPLVHSSFKHLLANTVPRASTIPNTVLVPPMSIPTTYGLLIMYLFKIERFYIVTNIW